MTETQEILTNIDNTASTDMQSTNDTASNTVTQRKSIIARILFITIGTIALVLGTIGVILPILPTTPFFLLTAYCYARGSQRFHNWFISSKLYKKHISGFAEHKAMSLKGELTLMICVSLMLMASCLIANLLVVSITLPILVLIKYTYFILAVRTVSSQELAELKTNKLEKTDA